MTSRCANAELCLENRTAYLTCDPNPQASALFRLWQWAFARYLSLQKRRNSHKMIKSLQKMSDAALADIGLRKHDVEQSNGLPTSTDAAIALHNLGLKR